MGFLKKFKNVLGSGKDEGKKPESQSEDERVNRLIENQFIVVSDESADKEGLESDKADKEGFGSDESEVFESDKAEKEDLESDKEEELFDETLRNFRYLDHMIHSGTKSIVLDSDIVLDDDEKSQYSSMIEVDVDDIIIDGNGYAIDARGKAGIFYVTGKNVTIRNITLKNASTRAEGGALLNEGELKIFNTTFRDNSSDDGAAINNFGTLEIDDSTFYNNSSRYGAGIFNEGGELRLLNSTFFENSSKENGGAISNSSKMTIDGTTFFNNRADVGGAIYNSGNLDILNSRFEDNIADTGGALHNNFKDLTVQDSTFQGNGARIGGVLSNEQHTKLFGCEILENYSQYNLVYNNDSLEISNSDFNGNHSIHTVYNEEDATLGIFYGSFEGNENMAVIMNSGKSCSINETVFENNLSRLNSSNILNRTELTLIKPKIKDEGASILNEGYALIRNPPSNFEGKITGEGEVQIVGEIEDGERFDFGHLDRIIHDSLSKEIVLDGNIRFENYERDYYEGGIELDIDDLVIDGNGMTIDGADKSRIFIITGNNITLRNIIFKNGRSHKNYDNPLNSHGGAFRINHNIKLTIEGCKFLSNVSEDEGGAIYGNGLELNIIESTLEGNSSKSNGGVIFTKEGNLHISYSSFHENSSENGGAIYNEKGELDIDASSFSNNKAKEGGVIWNLDGSLSIANSDLSDNSSERGVAIYDRNGKLFIDNSVFSKNIADYEGGAIFTRNGKLEISHTKLISNAAEDRGGAIFADNSIMAISKSLFNDNTVQKSGGAIFNDCGELSITDSHLSTNIARWCGGSIYLDGGTLNISRSTLNGNTAKNDFGGAIHNSRGEISIENSTLDSNSAGEYGGAIHNNGGKLNIAESVLSNNGARLGGSIYNKEWKLYMSELLMSDYEKKYERIGSNHTAGEVFISRSTLEGNSAGEDGGAICNRAIFDSVDCDFKGNKPNDVRNI